MAASSYSNSPDESSAAAAALRFTREELGPASERALSTPEAGALLLGRLRAGEQPGEAALGVLHRLARADPRIADEFVAHLLEDLMREGELALRPDLRRFVETGDLVNSMLGDLGRDLFQLHFQGRRPLLAFLGQRLQWKARDKARAERARNRREEVVANERENREPERSPSAFVSSREEVGRVVLQLLRLPDRDRELLALDLQGYSTEEIAERLEISIEAARKALQRARRKARELA